MITPEKCRAVAEVFRWCHKRYPEGVVNMHECNAVGGFGVHMRGIIHCHAGWYYVHHISNWTEEERKRRGNVCFGLGLEVMAKDLGFEDSSHLMDWAGDNPNVWGNGLGTGMFYDEEALGYPKDLLDIAKHWEGVADRLQTKERLQWLEQGLPS